MENKKNCLECGKIIDNSLSKDWSICAECFSETLKILKEYKKTKKL